MLNGLFRVVLCSLVIAGAIHAQEVIVAREKKPETAAQPTPPPEQIQPESATATPPPEQIQSESPTPPPPPPTKRKAREKKSNSTTPTLEQMRKAGALAAERLESPSPPPAATTSASDEQRSVAEAPRITATPRPAKKESRAEESRAEETRPSRHSSSTGAQPETIGPIRPSMMDSGREEPSATP